METARENAESPVPRGGPGFRIVRSDEEVRALQVFGEVDLDRVQVGDVHRLEQQAVLGDRDSRPRSK